MPPISQVVYSFLWCFPLLCMSLLIWCSLADLTLHLLPLFWWQIQESHCQDQYQGAYPLCFLFSPHLKMLLLFKYSCLPFPLATAPHPSPMISYRSFLVSDVTLEYSIHFELILFMVGARCSGLFFWMWLSNFPSIVSWGDYPFPIAYSWLVRYKII